MATLIASSKNYPKGNVQSYSPFAAIDQAVDSFINRVFRKYNRDAEKRLEIRNGRYRYTPSDEYVKVKAKFVNAKSIKK